MQGKGIPESRSPSDEGENLWMRGFSKNCELRNFRRNGYNEAKMNFAKGGEHRNRKRYAEREYFTINKACCRGQKRGSYL